MHAHKLGTEHRYQQRLINVIDYIYQNIERDLDVNTLADVANMSAYHFHRIFHQYAGETVNVTVRRMRLLKAAAYLTRTQLGQAEIAKRVNYGSIEAFNRAFTKHYGDTPAQYRESYLNAQPKLNVQYPTLKKEYPIMYQVEEIEFTEQTLIAMPHHGDYLDIGKAFDKLAIKAGGLGLENETTRFFGIYYDDPSTVETEKLRSKACMTVDLDKLDDNHDFEIIKIPAGKTVSLLFKGDYSELEQPYNWLFGEWLPKSNFELANFPAFEEYLNDQKDTPPKELLTRINSLVTQPN